MHYEVTDIVRPTIKQKVSSVKAYKVVDSAETAFAQDFNGLKLVLVSGTGCIRFETPRLIFWFTDDELYHAGKLLENVNALIHNYTRQIELIKELGLIRLMKKDKQVLPPDEIINDHGGVEMTTALGRGEHQ